MSRFLQLSTLSLAACAFSPLALAQANGEESNEPVYDLAEYPVQASADASAEGLTLPYAGGQVARGGRIGLLGSRDLLETPFSLTAYTSEFIQNQQAESVGDVLLNDPAVRVARGFGNLQQLYLVRGLPIYSDDMAYNGLYGLLPRQYLAAELIERVEVMRGANTFLNGAAPGGSGLGGAVNVMPKRAPSDPLTALTTGIQSGGQLYVAADVARRFQDDQVGVRVNVANRNGGTVVDGESVKTTVGAIGLDFRADKFRLSADLGYQNNEIEGSMPSITFAFTPARTSEPTRILKAPKADSAIAQPWTYSDEEDVFGTLRGEYDVSEYVTVWGAAGARKGMEASSFANPNVRDASGYTEASRFDTGREDVVLTGEIGARASFETGSFGHEITVTGAAHQFKSKNAYAMSAGDAVISNIYNPVPQAAPAADWFTGGEVSDPQETERTKMSSVAIAYQLSALEERLLVTAGWRYQSIDTKSYLYSVGSRGALSARYDEGKATPVGGVLFKLTEQVSVYGNYIEGLVKGDVANATNNGLPVPNAGEVLAPLDTTQYEVGVKADFGRFGGSLGLFKSDKPVAGYDADNYFRVLDGQDNYGIELSVYGELFESLKVLGGISLLDAELENGMNAIGSPEKQANLGLEWMLPFVDGLSVDGRVIYTSSQFADAANTLEVPSWVRYDLGLRYSLPVGQDQLLTLRARVENVADKDYWASAGGYPNAGYLTVGAPRTFMASATLSF
ncbi:MAG: TonB-dependent receptor [Verrucomicrobiota bacterium JB022]|nr:TonB-dependent receptor [Verrucomicrobiota bacterium JB022]